MKRYFNILFLITLSVFSRLIINQYEYSSNDYKINEVRMNEYLDDTSTLQENSQINNSDDYVSWGADYIGVNDYSNYLEDTYGVENLPEVIVAVIDTGVNTNHSWFKGRVAEGGANFSSSPDGEELVY